MSIMKEENADLRKNSFKQLNQTSVLDDPSDDYQDNTSSKNGINKSFQNLQQQQSSALQEDQGSQDVNLSRVQNPIRIKNQAVRKIQKVNLNESSQISNTSLHSKLNQDLQGGKIYSVSQFQPDSRQDKSPLQPKSKNLNFSLAGISTNINNTSAINTIGAHKDSLLSTTHAGVFYHNSSGLTYNQTTSQQENNPGMLSHRSNSIKVAHRLNMPMEGIEMLISQRRKKQTEDQLKILENRIKKLKEQEESTKMKSELKKRQIQQILLVRKRAQEERQIQEERRMQIQKEEDRKRNKVDNEKKKWNESRIRNQQNYFQEKQKTVSQLRYESNIRRERLNDIKMKEFLINQKKIKSNISPYKALEEKRQKLIDNTRTEYLKKVAVNHQNADQNMQKMQELQQLEQTLLERLQEHTLRQIKVQEEFMNLVGGSSRPRTSAIIKKQMLIQKMAEQSAISPYRQSNIVSSYQSQLPRAMGTNQKVVAQRNNFIDSETQSNQKTPSRHLSTQRPSVHSKIQAINHKNIHQSAATQLQQAQATNRSIITSDKNKESQEFRLSKDDTHRSNKQSKSFFLTGQQDIQLEENFDIDNFNDQQSQINNNKEFQNVKDSNLDSNFIPGQIQKDQDTSQQIKTPSNDEIEVQSYKTSQRNSKSMISGAEKNSTTKINYESREQLKSQNNDDEMIDQIGTIRDSHVSDQISSNVRSSKSNQQNQIKNKNDKIQDQIDDYEQDQIDSKSIQDEDNSRLQVQKKQTHESNKDNSKNQTKTKTQESKVSKSQQSVHSLQSKKQEKLQQTRNENQDDVRSSVYSEVPSYRESVKSQKIIETNNKAQSKLVNDMSGGVASESDDYEQNEIEKQYEENLRKMQLQSNPSYDSKAVNSARHQSQSQNQNNLNIVSSSNLKEEQEDDDEDYKDEEFEEVQDKNINGLQSKNSKPQQAKPQQQDDEEEEEEDYEQDQQEEFNNNASSKNNQQKIEENHKQIVNTSDYDDDAEYEEINDQDLQSEPNSSKQSQNQKVSQNKLSQQARSSQGQKIQELKQMNDDENYDEDDYEQDQQEMVQEQKQTKSKEQVRVSQSTHKKKSMREMSFQDQIQNDDDEQNQYQNSKQQLQLLSASQPNEDNSSHQDQDQLTQSQFQLLQQQLYLEQQQQQLQSEQPSEEYGQELALDNLTESQQQLLLQHLEQQQMLEQMQQMQNYSGNGSKNDYQEEDDEQQEQQYLEQNLIVRDQISQNQDQQDDYYKLLN